MQVVWYTCHTLLAADTAVSELIESGNVWSRDGQAELPQLDHVSATTAEGGCNA